ncbi:hypothetical protein ACIBQ1_34070 [Nonomuraea sp. NPDC050153]|uniref:hypothetical protein n=1 Tax=Nonomuraea sp. NPDC050153 TaxID=3364359 RepID=UPI0037BDFC48
MNKKSTIRTGRRDVRPDAPSHVKGVAEGNAPGGYERQKGHLPDGRSTARRSTGVNPRMHDPIDPDMPNLSPA